MLSSKLRTYPELQLTRTSEAQGSVTVCLCIVFTEYPSLTVLLLLA